MIWHLQKPKYPIPKNIKVEDNDLEVGDYVFASNWPDCDWNDPWGIGWIRIKEERRVELGTISGTLHPECGRRRFRYAKKIDVLQAARIISQYVPREGTPFEPLVAAEIWGNKVL